MGKDNLGRQKEQGSMWASKKLIDKSNKGRTINMTRYLFSATPPEAGMEITMPP